jgi:hypothetical protein
MLALRTILKLRILRCSASPPNVVQFHRSVSRMGRSAVRSTEGEGVDKVYTILESQQALVH